MFQMGSHYRHLSPNQWSAVNDSFKWGGTSAKEGSSAKFELISGLTLDSEMSFLRKTNEKCMPKINIQERWHCFLIVPQCIELRKMTKIITVIFFTTIQENHLFLASEMAMKFLLKDINYNKSVPSYMLSN